MRLILLALVLFASLPCAAQNAQRFLQEFSVAVKADDFVKQRELLSDNYDLGKDAFYTLEHDWVRVSLGTGDSAVEATKVAQTTLEALATVSKLVGQKSDYLSKRVAWLTGLTAEQKQAKLEMWDAIGRGAPLYGEARRLKKIENLQDVVPIFETAITKAEAATDSFWASQSHLYIAMIHEIVPNWYECVYHYKAAIAAGAKGIAAAEVAKQNLEGGLSQAVSAGKIKPEHVDLSIPVAESKAKYADAVAKAAADAAAANAAGKTTPTDPNMPRGPMPNVHSAPIELEDAAEFKTEKVSDTSYLTPFGWVNGHWYWWPAMGINKGATAKSAFLPGNGEVVNDGGKLLLFPNGKQNLPLDSGQRIKLAPKSELVEFKDAVYLDGSKGRVFHDMMSVPSQYNFIGFGFAMNADVLAIKFRGATVTRGKLRGVDVAVQDVNGNGSFTDYGIDCVLIGKGKGMKVSPLSRLIELDGLLYELKLEANGRIVRTKPYDGPLAAVRLEWKGGSTPAYLTCSGTGENSTYYFDLMQAKDKAIWVIPGALSFQHGYFIEGRGEKAVTMWITHGRSGVINAAPNALTTWKFGGAGDGFSFVFKATTKKEGAVESIQIPAKEIKIYGCFGEQYESPMMGTPLPTVSVRKAKETAVQVSGKMKKPDNEDSRESADLIFLPKSLELKKSFPGEFEARMEADWKPLGKIASAWTPGS